MSNHFGGRGNLGADPDLKHVEIGGEPRAVAALRIYCDRPVPDGDGGFTDKGGFWLPVNLWGPKPETIAKLLRKGARVRVEGTLVQDTWEDRETGEPTSRIEVQADRSTSISLGSRRSLSAQKAMANPRTPAGILRTAANALRAPLTDTGRSPDS
jgi:single-strand DNA-binding protein